MRDEGGFVIRDLPRILIVDVDPGMRRILRVSLQRHGYECMEAIDSKIAIAIVAKCKPDAILLDPGLPGCNSLAVIRHIRETVLTPIVVLSAQNDVPRKVMALELGADAYLTKPIDMDELLARLKVALRHGLQATGEMPVFQTGSLTVDLVRRKIFLCDDEVHLSPKEFTILRFLANNAGRVVSYQQLLKVLWEAGNISNVQYLRTLMWQMRQKLEPQSSPPRLLTTEPGVGYRLVVVPPRKSPPMRSE